MVEIWKSRQVCSSQLWSLDLVVVGAEERLQIPFCTKLHLRLAHHQYFLTSSSSFKPEIYEKSMRWWIKKSNALDIEDIYDQNGDIQNLQHWYMSYLSLAYNTTAFQCIHLFGFQKPMKVKVVKWGRKNWNEHDLMHIYHKQCEIIQKLNEIAQTARFTVFTMCGSWKSWFFMKTSQTELHCWPQFTPVWLFQGSPCESWRPGLSENVVLFQVWRI